MKMKINKILILKQIKLNLNNFKKRKIIINRNKKRK